MTTLLHISASPRGAASESRALADAFLETYLQVHPETGIDTFDLWDGSLPAFGPSGASAKMTAFAGQAFSDAQAATWRIVQEQVARFIAADAYLFSVPNWNAGVPYILKQYIDIITQPGLLFGFDPAAGYIGLVTGKTAAVMYTSGVYSPGAAPAFGRDFHSTYFTDWLHFIGIADVTEVRFQPTVLTADVAADRRTAHARARDAARTFPPTTMAPTPALVSMER